MTSQIKTIKNVSSEGLERHYHKYPIGLAEIVVIMSVSTFKICVICYFVCLGSFVVDIPCYHDIDG
jgi:hypothetical protein